MRRCIVGLVASGGVLFLAGAAGLIATWSLMGGALLLTTASVLAAVALEERDLSPWPPEDLRRTLEPAPLELAS
jgi:hypothetical protein